MENFPFLIFHFSFCHCRTRKEFLPPAPAVCRLPLPPDSHVPCSLTRNSSLIAIVSVRRFANRRLSRKSIGKPPCGVLPPNAGLEKIAASWGFNLCGTP